MSKDTARFQSQTVATGDVAGDRLFFQLKHDEAGFAAISELLKADTGINLPLNDKNLCLVASRLVKIMKRHEIRRYSDLVALMRRRSAPVYDDVVRSLTTNTTYFFRENQHFSYLSRALREIVSGRGRGGEIRIWCAAASTGQEVYTILMTCLEELGSAAASYELKFLATDINLDVLQKAARGLYTEAEMKGVPPELVSRYFEQRPIGLRGDRQWQVKTVYRKMVTFATFNLVAESYPFQHRFDVIFCRNVLIYFDRETNAGILKKLTAAMADGGYLFVGHSETGALKPKNLRQVAIAVSQKIA